MESSNHTGSRPDAREIETLIYDKLSSFGINFEAKQHAAAATIADCTDINLSFGDAEHCKNVFLCNRQETLFFLLLMKGDKKFRTAEVSKQIGQARLSFASDAHLKDKLNILPGAVSPMGLLFDQDHEVRLLIDEDLLKNEKILFHPCVNTASLKMRVDDFTGVFLKRTGHGFEKVRLSE